MTTPTVYARYRDYAQAQSDSPQVVLNGADFNADFDRVKATTDSLATCLSTIRKDDGTLKNSSVGLDQLTAAVILLLNGITPRGAWANSLIYAVGDVVSQSSNVYVCLVSHTAGVFATDLAALKWMLLTNLASASSVSNAPAGGIAATTVQAAIDELDSEKQPIDATLTALAALTTAANKLIYATGSDAFATTDLTVAARALLDDVTADDMLTTLGALPQAGGTMTGALTLSGAPTTDLHAATKLYADALANASRGASGGVRQTVSAGPVSSVGLPSFLPSTNAALSITSQNLSSSYPMVATAANNWSATTGVPVNLVGYSTANLTWSGLTASKATATPNFLYVLVNADGSLTPGSTLLAPVYQWGGTPSTTSGQFTFNISEMKGYLGNGSTAPQAYVVFVGEAATDGSGVISTVAYAYNGRYESLFTNTLPSAGAATPASHNIGVIPRNALWIAECISTELGYSVGEQIDHTNNAGNNGTFSTALAISRTRTVLSFNSSGNPYGVLHKTTGTYTALDVTKWKYKFAADRGW